ncbi:hypothetical protein BpHYR1_022998 [Brachionus plicatilis]|uniref:C-type lectin domain-containing protein n=1 Tax=Brachionus plicatilis TaxID=10195 RepID=A0A3M7QVV6_BRAPC|nr:hypothetical protein BpHYR1_022998 [Brachionus plicatilis]
MYSNSLVTMETSKKWKELIDQLNNLKLHDYSFRIGLAFNFTSNLWQWSKHLDQRANGNLKWCEDDKFYQNFDCASLAYGKNWCLRTIPCNQEEPFICEWRPNQFRTHNAKLVYLGNYFDELDKNNSNKKEKFYFKKSN